MKIQNLIKVINQNTLIEIINEEKIRFFYGTPNEMSKFVLSVLSGSNVLGVNCFNAETSPQEKVSSMQIVVDKVI